MNVQRWELCLGAVALAVAGVLAGFAFGGGWAVHQLIRGGWADRIEQDLAGLTGRART